MYSVLAWQKLLFFYFLFVGELELVYFPAALSSQAWSCGRDRDGILFSARGQLHRSVCVCGKLSLYIQCVSGRAWSLCVSVGWECRRGSGGDQMHFKVPNSTRTIVM